MFFVFWNWYECFGIILYKWVVIKFSIKLVMRDIIVECRRKGIYKILEGFIYRLLLSLLEFIFLLKES